MNSRNVTTRNVDIAKMLGYIYVDNGMLKGWYKLGGDRKFLGREDRHLKFHKDWNYLMTAAKFIGLEHLPTDISQAFVLVSDFAEKLEKSVKLNLIKNKYVDSLKKDPPWRL